MNRDECRSAVLGRIWTVPARGDKLPLVRDQLFHRLERLMSKHYPPRTPTHEGASVLDYFFQKNDVLELERKLRRGEGV